MRRFRLDLASILLAATAAAAAAQVPPDQLARPPADALGYTVLSPAGRHGSIAYWTAPDGSLKGRYSLVLRGQVWEEDETVRLGADGALADYELRGSSPSGDVAESFRVAGGEARWRSQVDSGAAPYRGRAFYFPAGPSIRATDPLIEWLVAHPGDEAALLPSGRARAEKLTALEVGAGPARQTVTAWTITGIAGTPFAVWTDAGGRFFAALGGLATLRAGYEHELDHLQKAQDEALARQSPILARSLARLPNGPVAFTNVRAFLDGGRFADDQTILVDKGVIVAAGPAASVRIPAGAERIDGRGKTLVPGLWDAHQHVSDDYAGPQLLALGITSVRDPGNNDKLTLARRDRRASGDLLEPHVHASSLIDGKGPNTAQVANVATSQAEAIRLVDQARAQGQIGVKFYGTFDPAWIAPAAAEAHGKGLHVHGHLPAGMRPMQAIAAGYDEITHIYFVAMQAMPDDVVAHSNGMQRFSGTGRYFKDVDLDGEPMRSLIATMAAKKIVSDPTLNVVEALFVPENGDVSPAYAPFVGTMPPAVERSFRQGGFAPPAGVTRADYRASFRKLVALVGRMHKAGVPIVAGTDGGGMELVRELELYVEAGFTPAEALAAATIVPARLVGVADRTGTIAAGKAADLVLVDGDPSQRIGDLRHTRVVMMDGRIMDADKLRAAVGVSARPAHRVID
jgi:imidazolonepropionase-like amidohydrolase